MSSSISIADLDSLEITQLQKSSLRRQRCAETLPKIFLTLYIVSALTLTVLCVTVWRSTLLSTASSALPLSSSSSSASFHSLALGEAAVDSDGSQLFDAMATCANSNDNLCTNSQGSWCCSSSSSCGSSLNSCNSNVGLIVGIIIAIWLGPLILYLAIIAIVRCSQSGRFDALANSGRYQSWVIVSGCFQMSINSSSGDAEFNQVAFNMVNVFGGCGDECVMHCIGIWCLGFCYPCCMCCVSAGRNQGKVGTLQGSLANRGYNTHVQFLSSIIPACCNSIFIGLISRQPVAGNVMVVTSSNGQVYAQPAMYGQPGVQYVQQPGVQYAQPVYSPQSQGQYLPQPQYAQPQYAQQPYAQVAAAPTPAPAYTAVPTNDVMTSGVVSAQPPEVEKPRS